MTYRSVNYISLIAPQILDCLDPTGSPFRKCLRLLRGICGYQMILPSTYDVSDELSFTTTRPVKYNGFCDVYRGTLSGGNVGIERFRTPALEGPLASIRVAYIHIFDPIAKP